MCMLRGSREVEASLQLIHHPELGGLPCRELVGSRRLSGSSISCWICSGSFSKPRSGCSWVRGSPANQSIIEEWRQQETDMGRRKIIFSSCGLHGALPSPTTVTVTF